MCSLRNIFVVATFLLASQAIKAQNVKNVFDMDVDSYQGYSYNVYRSLTLKPGFEFSAIEAGTSFFIKVIEPDYLSDTIFNPIVASANSIVVENAMVKGIKSNSGLDSAAIGQKYVDRTYFDGLYRPTQKISQQYSPGHKDLVKVYNHQNLTNERIEYLPYVSNNSTGEYNPNGFSDLYSFYGSGETNNIQSDAKPLKVTKRDGFVTELGDFGTAWQPDSGYTKKVSYRVSSASDQVIIWNENGNSGYYADSQLSVTETISEDSLHIISFFDKYNRLVLERVVYDDYINEDNVNTFVQYLDTYNVYDDLGLLTYKISPKAVAKIKGGAIWNSTFINEWAFRYSYDEKRRLIEKKVPGKGEEKYVYDQFNRLVLYQDANMSQTDKWMYYKYTAGHKKVLEGIYNFEEIYPGLGMSPHEQLQKYYRALNYKDSHVYAGEKKVNSSSTGYSNRTFPLNNTTVYKIYYYDDYDFDSDGTADYSYQPQGLAGEAASGSGNITGFLTGVKERIENTTDWLASVIFYDAEGRVIQTRSNNQLYNSPELKDVTSFVYHGFMSSPVIEKTVNHSSQHTSVTLQHRYDYDHTGRVNKIFQAINGSAEQELVNYKYNSLGQLADKDLYKRSGGAYLQSIDYYYNIRGWITSINNSELLTEANDNGVDDLFGMEVLYNKTDGGLGNSGLYDGKISAVKWKTNDIFSGSTNPVNENSYKFYYDRVNRLKDADFVSKGTSGWNVNIGGYDEKNITYDHNGNILTLQRYETLTGSSNPVLIDNLTYLYGEGRGNRLRKVLDSSGSGTGFKSAVTDNEDGFEYDLNGNLITDRHKGNGTTPMSIVYNDFGKVTSVVLPGGKSIIYKYAASGQRLSKEVFDANGLLKRINYIGRFVYENDSLSFFSSAEGRVRYVAGVFKHEFFITDHLGNVRVSFEEYNGQARIVQENHYYPFGLSMKGKIMRTGLPPSPNKNLYNAGSELQDDFGDDPNFYSTFFREYDPVLGRMNGIDPMADTYSWLSPYNYAFNNPVSLNDPTGADPFESWNEVFDWVEEAKKTDYGAMWIDGSTYEYRSHTDAFYAAAAYNDYFDSWDHTYAGSYEPAAENFNSYVADGLKGATYANSYQAERFIVMGEWFRDKAGKPTTIGGISGRAHVVDLYRGGSEVANSGGWENSKTALDIGGGLYGAAEGLVAPKGQWLGNNGKYYSTSWGGNQYTGSRAGALKAASMYKWAGGATVVAASLIGGIETYNGYQMDGGQFGYNAQMAAAKTIGGMGGGIAGAALGAKIGAGIGVWFGGVGAIPGAVIGGFVGGYVGGSWGSNAGESAINWYHR